jgi:hypothetical protein
MEKKELKLKKETLSNLTNLNIREMEELKGGVAVRKALDSDASLTVSITFSWSVSWSWSW